MIVPRRVIAGSLLIPVRLSAVINPAIGDEVGKMEWGSVASGDFHLEPRQVCDSDYLGR